MVVEGDYSIRERIKFYDRHQQVRKTSRKIGQIIAAGRAYGERGLAGCSEQVETDEGLATVAAAVLANEILVFLSDVVRWKVEEFVIGGVRANGKAVQK